jgi:spore photoproduct lyase
LNIKHNKHTDFRFSLNTDYVIKSFEHGTPCLDDRLSAARRLAAAGYSVGMMIAPVFIYDGWQADYGEVMNRIKNELADYQITFEVVTHRYTEKAKESINKIFPKSKLDMINENRSFKFGQFGYGKYIYKPEDMQSIKEYFKEQINSIPNARLLYIV